MPGMAGIDFISDLHDQVGAWADAFLSETSTATGAPGHGRRARWHSVVVVQP